MKRLVIQVIEISGRCPVYKLNDRIILNEGFKVDLQNTDAICMHSLGSIIPYYNALFKGIGPKNLGLSKDNDTAYLQCLNPCKYTGGGTVIFGVFCEEIIEISCYSGFRYGEKPEIVTLDNKEFRIKKILRDWREPEKIFFDIILENDEKIKISFSERDNLWRKER